MIGGDWRCFDWCSGSPRIERPVFECATLAHPGRGALSPRPVARRLCLDLDLSPPSRQKREDKSRTSQPRHCICLNWDAALLNCEAIAQRRVPIEANAMTCRRRGPLLVFCPVLSSFTSSSSSSSSSSSPHPLPNLPSSLPKPTRLSLPPTILLILDFHRFGSISHGSYPRNRT